MMVILILSLALGQCPDPCLVGDCDQDAGVFHLWFDYDQANRLARRPVPDPIFVHAQESMIIDWIGGNRPADGLDLSDSELLRRLGAESWRTREAASRAVAAMGPAGSARVVAWGLASDDPEIRVRCEDLARKLGLE